MEAGAFIQVHREIRCHGNVLFNSHGNQKNTLEFSGSHFAHHTGSSSRLANAVFPHLALNRLFQPSLFLSPSLRFRSPPRSPRGTKRVLRPRRVGGKLSHHPFPVGRTLGLRIRALLNRTCCVQPTLLLGSMQGEGKMGISKHALYTA